MLGVHGTHLKIKSTHLFVSTTHRAPGRPQVNYQLRAMAAGSLEALSRTIPFLPCPAGLVRVGRDSAAVTLEDVTCNDAMLDLCRADADEVEAGCQVVTVSFASACTAESAAVLERALADLAASNSSTSVAATLVLVSPHGVPVNILTAAAAAESDAPDGGDAGAPGSGDNDGQGDSTKYCPPFDFFLFPPFFFPSVLFFGCYEADLILPLSVLFCSHDVYHHRRRFASDNDGGEDSDGSDDGSGDVDDGADDGAEKAPPVRLLDIEVHFHFHFFFGLLISSCAACGECGDRWSLRGA